MPAEFFQHSRFPLADQIQRIAQVEAGNRTARALDLAAVTGCEYQCRTMETLLQPGGDNADHALVPVVTVQRDGVVLGRIDFGQFGQCLVLHAVFDLPPFLVQPVELARQSQRLFFIVAEQAFDAEPHVVEPAGRVQPRPEHETKVEAGCLVDRPATGREQCTDAGRGASGAHALEPLLDQNAVVVIQSHHVRHCAERDQVQQRRQIGLPGRIAPDSPLTHLGTQGHQHVEHHAATGQVARRERTAGLVRVDDQRVRQCVTGQVMVGHQHFDAARPCRIDPGHAGDAVVDGDDQVRLARRRQVDDFRRQPVTVFEAVGHDELDHPAQQTQALDRDRTGGGPVGVVVGHDQHALPPGDGIGQPGGHAGGVLQLPERQQPGQGVVELDGVVDATRRIQARHQRGQALPGQVAGQLFGYGTGNDQGHRLCRRATPPRERTAMARGRITTIGPAYAAVSSIASARPASV